MVPDCGLVITLRPLPVPTMLRSASLVSAQISELEVVETWLLSSDSPPFEFEPLPLPDWLLLLLLLLFDGAAPELTRVSLRPWRLACR